MIHFIFFSIVGLFTYKKYPKAKVQHKYGLIIPARNEEKVVGNLIKSIQKNKYPQDKLQIFLIAHNCTDRTAEIGRELGATVYEYNNPNECTMGYAFRYLFKQIEKDYGTQNYDGFFLFNADNILSTNYFEKMNDAFDSCNGEYVITSFRNSKNFGSNVISGMYGLYFMIGCRLESRGRTVLNCSTRVQGTGYVINSKLVKDGWPYVTLTEDWEFSADQIILNNKIKYCDEAVFYDEQPTNFKVMWRQRVRWSRGHLLVFFSKTKALLKNLFSGKKGKHKVSTYDILINIMPFCLVLTGIGLLQFILLCFAPLIDGVGFWSVIWPYLRTMLMFTGISFVTCMLSAIVIFIVERKRIKNVKWWQKIIMTFCWPLFLLIQFPIDVVAVCQPITASYVTFGCHIIAEFINIYHVAYLLPYLLVGWVGSQLLGQSQPLPESISCAGFLLIADRAVQLKLVNLVSVYAVSALAIMLVVVLAYVQHAKVLPVEEYVARLPGLAVDVKPRTQENLV